MIDERLVAWREHVSEGERASLDAMGEEEREDAFYRDLAFGTGGLRGKLGIGSNRMNTYTVGRATQGLADYLNARFDRPSVAICRDTRHGGAKFVRRIAEVLAANGVRSFLFERVEPTPALSFAVRELGCSAGVNVTASHNPAEYNGYKVYGPDGCQITLGAAGEIQAAIDVVDAFAGVRRMPLEEAWERGLVRWIPESVLNRYIDETLKVSTGADCSSLKIVYTPLHGVGLECVSRALDEAGVGEVVLVDEQCEQDGSFPTCPYPNPEVPDALGLGLAKCAETGADMLVATDPDADRVAVAVAHDGSYGLVSGNELGLLLLDFLAGRAVEAGADASHLVAVTTIVSAPMADDLARAYGFELRRTLTGFKFIGEQIGLLEAEGREGDFLMSFEESCGYLAGTHARDKDAVVASVLACELAAHWKARGLDLVDAMENLYERHGHWACETISVAHDGPDGAERIAGVMAGMRANPPAALGGMAVTRAIDYAEGAEMPVVNPSGAAQELPAADVVELALEGGSRAVFRPSGTEPKAKAYLFARGASREEAEMRLAAMGDAARAILEGAE